MLRTSASLACLLFLAVGCVETAPQPNDDAGEDAHSADMDSPDAAADEASTPGFLRIAPQLHDFGELSVGSSSEPISFSVLRSGGVETVYL